MMTENRQTSPNSRRSVVIGSVSCVSSRSLSAILVIQLHGSVSVSCWTRNRVHRQQAGRVFPPRTRIAHAVFVSSLGACVNDWRHHSLQSIPQLQQQQQHLQSTISDGFTSAKSVSFWLGWKCAPHVLLPECSRPGIDADPASFFRGEGVGGRSDLKFDLN